MKYKLNFSNEISSYTAEFEAVGAWDVKDELKLFLLGVGFHPNTVDDIFGDYNEPNDITMKAIHDADNRIDLEDDFSELFNDNQEVS